MPFGVGVDQPELVHDLHRLEPEVVVGVFMGQPHQARVVVVVVLQARAERHRHGEPLVDVHGVVVLVVVATGAIGPRVREVVLDHVHPQREDAHADPHREGELQIAGDEPEEREAEDLREDGERVRGDEAHRPRAQDLLVAELLDARVGEHAKIERAPEAVAVELVRIAGMVGVLVVQAVPVHPARRVDVEPEQVVGEGDRLHEPLLIVEGSVRDAEVEHVGQVEPRQEPAEQEVCGAEGERRPRGHVRRREAHAARSVERGDRVPRQVVALHARTDNTVSTSGDGNGTYAGCSSGLSLASAFGSYQPPTSAASASASAGPQVPGS